MNSFAILRTNVGLTTNIKIMIDSNYRLSINSIDSNENLSNTKFKKVDFNKKNYFDELVSYFFKDFPSELAFEIKYDNDNNSMIDNYKDQYDELYQYGARNIIDNKNYIEEYEYFAPLYINPKSLPKKFIIFRVDGPGIDILNKSNFNEKIIKKLKTVKIFDLEKSSPLGEWLERNFKNNKYFPDTPLEMDFRNLEFCKWNGIDYERGGYISRSLFIDDVLEEEKELFELDKFIFDSYKNNKLVFPNILNLSFLFDDTPSTPDSTKKWTLNRYFGFYLDEMDLVKTVSPYITPFLRTNVVVLEGNILYSPTNDDPFVEGFSATRPFYVEYNGQYYLVERFAESMGIWLQPVEDKMSTTDLKSTTEEYTELYKIKYKIISDIDLEGKENELNKNYGTINSDNVLIDYDANNLSIEDFDSADVWLIEINGIYHNIVKQSDGSLKLNTDYSFNFTENYYTYKSAGNEIKVSFVVDNKNQPKKFNIYKLKFTDIKDFDDRIIDTEYSKYEYEKESELTLTDETKMYCKNIQTNTNPKELDDFLYKDEVVNIPVSSEYTANFETFKIENGDLTQLWRKNSTYCRWGYQNSLSANDVPYLLNNSLIFEDYNRSINPFEPNPIRIERNLDYFYTVNSSTSSYTHHSLHVESFNGKNIDIDFNFDIEKYLNTGTYSYDYFTAFFERSTLFNSGKIKKNVKKYSQFNKGDNIIPNITLFRGIEFRLFDIESVMLDSSNDIETINVKNSNQFEDYKFSILLSENKQNYTSTNCFDLNIQPIITQKDCFNIDPFDGCPLTYESKHKFYISENLLFANYEGWFLVLDGQLTDFEVVSATISNPYVLMTIHDSNGDVVTEADIISSGGSLCNFCFAKVENRIVLPEQYMETINPGDTLNITSTCFTGGYKVYGNQNVSWDYQSSVAIEDIPDLAPINFEINHFDGTSSYVKNYTSYKSTNFYGQKKYYTLYLDSTPYAYALFDNNQSRWELWTEFNGATPSGTQLAYLEETSTYPVSSNWINTFSYLQTYNSEFKPKKLSATCSGTVCHIDNYTSSDIKWKTIEQWQMDKEYEQSSIVLHDDVLYVANTYIDMSIAKKPTVLLHSKQVKAAPYNVSQWGYYTPDLNIFWSPPKSAGILGSPYVYNDYVFNNGDFYYCQNPGGVDFWNPEIAKLSSGYNADQVVLYKGKYYISMTHSNHFTPDYNRTWFALINNLFVSKPYWKKTSEPSNSMWKPIEIWNPSKTYILTVEKIVVHNDILYKSNTMTIESGEEPGISPYWTKIYNIKPNSSTVYSNVVNPIIDMNGRYYLCISNSTKSTLENGINIYINKKWKNVLVNIAINDNTLPNISNCDRDLIYNELYSKLTAYNFIKAINNLSDKSGFIDYIKYKIIEENGSFKDYSFNNIKGLPYLLQCETPEELSLKLNSLEVDKVDIPKELKSTKVLNKSKINNLSELNWYSGIEIAYSILKNDDDIPQFNNIHGIKNIISDTIYRYTGYYMPLFYDIQIFEKNFEYKLPGNYKFDTTLTEFGIMKERRLRKVNHKGSVLKLRNLNNYKSIYPMLDEFGYTTEDFFIFRSTWDQQYHTQTVNNDIKSIISLGNNGLSSAATTTQMTQIGQPPNQNQSFNI